ncbi:MAG: N-acetyltransferase family protein [Pirellulaceae bacterium]
MDVHDVLIRPAVASVPSDANQIAATYNHYIDAGSATFDRVHWTSERVAKFIASPLPDGWYVADYDGAILGWASARQFSDRFGFRFSCETAIYLHHEAVGRKVADMLQAQIELHCRENEIHHAVAKIIATNHRSLAFHYRHGYDLVGTQKEIGHINDEWTDLVILQKIFR